ncbi:unnamed protein product [Dicrocoelium dendriticum]|nr:unnamed protein product [Dicrocoelium dendriticum]
MADKSQSLKTNSHGATTKVSKEISSSEKSGDSRNPTALKKTRKTQKETVISKTIEEAKSLLGNDLKLADAEAGRALRVRPKRVHHTSPGRSRKPPTKRGNSKITKKVPSGPTGDSAPN